MELPQDFKSLQEQIQSALVATTKSSNTISSEDLAFHRSLNPEVSKELDQQSARLLGVAKSLLKSAASLSGLRTPDLQDVDDVDNNWRGVVDVLDSLLEKADICLDEYTGVIKRKPEEPSTLKKHPSQLDKSFRNQNLLKPQLSFAQKPQNDDDSSPWKPLLTSKPHAIIPLEKSLDTLTDEFGHKRFRHPYETEITQLKYPDAVYQQADPIEYLPIQNTTATWVDTFEGVQEMLKELKLATEIAVDLEHHDFRSYIGLVSLMQISTRNKDWIVDTLKPWRQDLQILNQVFTDPKIIKVFHGAYMDIVWLQRDLGLYVNGLFDTHHACRTLGYPGGSLAYLLKRFVDFDADKKYQMADWRIRPLPEEMFFYARSDTHFLLYIYDNVRNDLVQKSDQTNPENDRIEIVLQKSKETSLLRYDKQIYEYESGRGPGGWYNLLVKTPQIKTKEQLSVFRAVHAWRDRIARKDDDGVNFVMSNQVLGSIAARLPKDMTALYSAIHPISYNVKSRMDELLDVIKQAIAAGASGPSVMDLLNPGSLGAITKQIRQAKGNGTTASSSMKPSPIIVKPSTTSEPGSLRMTTSKFWGDAFGSSIWDGSAARCKAASEGLIFTVPMPPLSSKAFSTSTSSTGDVLKGPDVKSVSKPAVREVKKETADDTIAFPGRDADDSAFNLKRNKKRKSDAMAAGDIEDVRDQDAIDLDNAHNATLQQAKSRRLLSNKKGPRTGAKISKKQGLKLRAELYADRNLDTQAMEVDDDEAEVEDEEDAIVKEEEEDFDYSKAESVLHSKNRGGGGGGGKKEKKGKGKEKKPTTPFDPYAKSANAAKGLRRQQGGGDGGRSMTFRK